MIKQSILLIILSIVLIVKGQTDFFYNFKTQQLIDGTTNSTVRFDMGQIDGKYMCLIGTTTQDVKIYRTFIEDLTMTSNTSIILNNFVTLNSQNFPSVNLSIQNVFPDGLGCSFSTPTHLVFITFPIDGGAPTSSVKPYPGSYVTELTNQVLYTRYGSTGSFLIYSAIDSDNGNVLLIAAELDNTLIIRRVFSFQSTSPVRFSKFDGNLGQVVITTADGTIRTFYPAAWFFQGNALMSTYELPSGYTLRDTFQTFGAVFSCLQSSNGDWSLETIPGPDIHPITYNGSSTIQFSRCIGGYYDYNQYQLIIMVKNSLGGVNFLYLSPYNSQPALIGSLGFNVNVLNPTPTNGLFYPAFEPDIYSTSVFMGFSGSTDILSFNYSSFCTDNCNGFLAGNCQSILLAPYYQCSCNEYYIGDTCASSLPFLSEDYPLNVSYYDVIQQNGARITLYGNPFSNTSDYIIQIDNYNCVDIQYISPDSASCVIQYDSNAAPFYDASWYMEFTSDSSITRDGSIQNFWGKTEITHIYQTNYLVFDTKYAVPLKYLEFSWAGNYLTCDIISNNTQYSCPLLPTQGSGILIILNNYTTEDIFNGEISVTPYISGYLPTTPIPTLSSTITIQGQYFSDLVPQHTSINVGGESLTYSTVAEGLVVVLPDGIKLDNSVSIYINGTKISNSIPLVYQAPQVDSNYTQGAVPNVFTISGVNFGYEESLVEISVTPSHHPLDIYSATVQTVEQSKIVFSIPDTAQYGELTVTVDDADGNKLEFALPPFISEISPLPNIDGSDIITIKGRYLFGTTISTSIGNGDDLDCSFSNGSNYQSFAYCQSIAGTGTFSINVACEVGNVLKSHQFESNFHAPTIDQVTPTSYKKGINTTFTITGSNFANVGLYVTINGENCTVTGNEFPESFLCNLIPQSDPTTVTNPVKISVTVDDIQGHNSIINYEKPCPDNCSNHGSCDLIAGKCTCEAEYTSDNCSQLKDTSSEDLSNSPFITYSTFITLLSFAINIIF
ncbi:hypothetical protein DLAC_01366 [Tieghemostelium lacteum]|uniref:EGF-like domain-containing protein n=1 Tax=Tieghemostelium lacteum TaxID=361077 RepID=A0A152A8H4_TIELA|nr:hypothetical protein DLAC_01366 [Tieghemostelium lacteum]|eukprot:KYR02522.1 hypothetical protein DLAC_01366 [Tieghemostelium lacteum]